MSTTIGNHSGSIRIRISLYNCYYHNNYSNNLLLLLLVVVVVVLYAIGPHHERRRPVRRLHRHVHGGRL